MTNDVDCVSIDVVGRRRVLSARTMLNFHRKSTPMPSTPSAPHSILLISSQNTDHLRTYIARNWLDRLSCRATTGKPDCPAATRSGELYKSLGSDGFRLASRIYCRLLSWGRGTAGAPRRRRAGRPAKMTDCISSTSYQNGACYPARPVMHARV